MCTARSCYAKRYIRFLSLSSAETVSGVFSLFVVSATVPDPYLPDKYNTDVWKMLRALIHFNSNFVFPKIGCCFDPQFHSAFSLPDGIKDVYPVLDGKTPNLFKSLYLFHAFRD